MDPKRDNESERKQESEDSLDLEQDVEFKSDDIVSRDIDHILGSQNELEGNSDKSPATSIPISIMRHFQEQDARRGQLFKEVGQRQQAERDQAGAATARDGGGLRTQGGDDELDRVRRVHLPSGVQETDVANPVALAVLDGAPGAQALQRGGERFQLGHRGRSGRSGQNLHGLRRHLELNRVPITLRRGGTGPQTLVRPPSTPVSDPL